MKLTVSQVIVLVCGCLTAGGPVVVQSMSPHEVQLTVLIVGAISQVSACILALFHTSPADAPVLKAWSDLVARHAAKAAGVVSCFLLCALVGGCAWLKTSLPKIDADVEAALPIACEVIELADPSQGQLICAIIDEAGNIVGDGFTLTEKLEDAKAFAAKHPSLAALVRKANAKLIHVSAAADEAI